MNNAYPEPQDVARLEKAANNLRDFLLNRLLFRTGCRVSEALALTVDDIDFDAGTIRIEHLKTRIKLSCEKCGARLGRSHVFCPACGTKVEGAVAGEQHHRRLRTLPVDRETMAIVADFVKRGGPIAKEGKLYIFGISRHQAWRIVADCARRAGLGKVVNPESGRSHNISPHRLRDGFATLAMKLDDSSDGTRLLQEHLGHASFNTTARYRKVSGREHRDWYEKLWAGEARADESQAK